MSIHVNQTDIIIASSRSDADAWLRLHAARYRHPENLYFFIIGHAPEKYHAEFIQAIAAGRKIHFLFSKDDTGALCDLKLAAYIRDKTIKIRYHDQQYQVEFENKHYTFDRLSLNALEKASGYNFRIRTHKPKNANSYHEQFRQRHPH